MILKVDQTVPMQTVKLHIQLLEVEDQRNIPLARTHNNRQMSLKPKSINIFQITLPFLSVSDRQIQVNDL